MIKPATLTPYANRQWATLDQMRGTRSEQFAYADDTGYCLDAVEFATDGGYLFSIR